MENHFITTDDGYILGVHRIPYGKDPATRHLKRRPVFLQHGLLNSDADWLINPTDRALGSTRIKFIPFSFCQTSKQTNSLTNKLIILMQHSNLLMEAMTSGWVTHVAMPTQKCIPHSTPTRKNSGTFRTFSLVILSMI